MCTAVHSTYYIQRPALFSIHLVLLQLQLQPANPARLETEPPLQRPPSGAAPLPCCNLEPYPRPTDSRGKSQHAGFAAGAHCRGGPSTLSRAQLFVDPARRLLHRTRLDGRPRSCSVSEVGPSHPRTRGLPAVIPHPTSRKESVRLLHRALSDTNTRPSPVPSKAACCLGRRWTAWRSNVV